MGLVEYSVTRRVVVWTICAIVLVVGYLAFGKLARYEDPEFLIRQAVVVTPYPGALPSQVADEVTDVIEGAVQQLQELEEVRSVSRFGSSVVHVEIAMRFGRSRADLEQVWDKLRRRIVDTQRLLPPGAGPSVVNDDYGDVYALLFAVTGAGYGLKQIDDYVDGLQRELQLVPGVARVTTLGAPQEAIFVEVSASGAAQLGIPLEQIHATLRAQNLLTPAGDVLAGSRRVQLSPSGQVDSVESIRNVVLATRAGGQVVFLGDVADVTRDFIDPPKALVRYGGNPAVALGISNVSGANVVELGRAVRARLAELESQRPVGMELNVVSDQPAAVKAAVDDFVANLVLALVIVWLVLVVFMGLRSALVVGAVLLLTVAATMIVLYVGDIALHRVSLGALIIALGMLVDNAIVVTDGILVRIQGGEAPERAAVEVVRRTQWPLLGGTVVGILAFSAIGLAATDMGEYVGLLFWVILYSMLLSWLFAVTAAPLMCVAWLRAVPGAASSTRPGRFARAYRGVLRAVLRRRAAYSVLLVAMLGAALVGFGFIPPGFMPDSTRPQFAIDVALPQGTDILATAAELAAIEEHVRAQPGVTQVTSFVGQGALRFMLSYGPHDADSSYGQLLIDVEDSRQISALVAALQAELTARHPRAQVKAWKFSLGRGGGKKIEAVFRGPDAAVLRRLADEAKAVMAADPEASAIEDDWRQKVPVLRPALDEVAAQRARISATDIGAALERTFRGAQVGVYREGDRLIPIVSRAPPDERTSADQIDSVHVYSPSAQRYLPVGQFVRRVEIEWVDPLIRRVDRFPTIKAQSDPLPGRLPGPLLDRLRPQIEAIELPPGYSLSWEGEAESSGEANAGIIQAAPYSFAAMVLTVIVLFNAFRQVLVIWLSAALSIIGVTLGLLLWRLPFEFMAILGFLSLIGMLIKNSIVLVDEADLQIGEGKEPFAAVLDAATSRARPVFLGAATTILGVAPLLADPFFRSMAVTIMSGLAVATLLTLLVVPMLYAMFFGIREQRPDTGSDSPLDSGLDSALWR